jgi:hypothetical protein
VHSDNVIRLWNTDDGRCILSSHPDFLTTPAKAMIKIDNLPGFIAIVGNTGDVYIVNVYPMRILSHLMLDFTGISKIRYIAKTHTLIICDANGKLIVCVD